METKEDASLLTKAISCTLNKTNKRHAVLVQFENRPAVQKQCQALLDRNKEYCKRWGSEDLMCIFFQD
jgi:hypothetical protein